MTESFKAMSFVERRLAMAQRDALTGLDWGEWETVAISDAMRRVLDQMERAARSDSPVLLTGEVGTGKKSVAETIHRHGHRQAGPLIRVNVAALAVAAVEKRLFGSGESDQCEAERQRPGAFGAADGGTLFIEEIGHLPKTAQARLLRALEKPRTAFPDDNPEVLADVRVIASTSRDLYELVAQERFRANLYYRLNVIPIDVPPLRQRREDIPALVRRTLDEICAGENLSRVRPDSELMRLLEDYDWPGNLRQLRACLRSIVRFSKTERLAVRDWPSDRDTEPEKKLRELPDQRLADLERMAMVEALEQHGGNRTSAAEALGISVRTLQRKLKKWSEERPNAGQ